MNYNPHGSPAFITIYSEAAKFADFWVKLCNYILQYQFPIGAKKPLERLRDSSASIKCTNMTISKEDFDFPVYFIMIKIGS